MVNDKVYDDHDEDDGDDDDDEDNDDDDDDDDHFPPRPGIPEQRYLGRMQLRLI